MVAWSGSGRPLNHVWRRRLDARHLASELDPAGYVNVARNRSAARGGRARIDKLLRLFEAIPKDLPRTTLGLYALGLVEAQGEPFLATLDDSGCVKWVKIDQPPTKVENFPNGPCFMTGTSQGVAALAPKTLVFWIDAPRAVTASA